jgi:hypothetical protein
MREMLLTHKDILLNLEKMERTLSSHDDKIMLLFEYIKQFEKLKQEELDQKKRPRIGFKSENIKYVSYQKINLPGNKED